jgi:hypothetical protein
MFHYRCYKRNVQNNNCCVSKLLQAFYVSATFIFHNTYCLSQLSELLADTSNQTSRTSYSVCVIKTMISIYPMQNCLIFLRLPVDKSGHSQEWSYAAEWRLWFG